MILQNLEQGTPEWKLWRKSKIMATDSPIILGVNPYKTPYKLWREKLSLDDEMTPNERMLEGARLEPIAREAFVKHLNLSFEPLVCVSKEFDWMGASLDGFNQKEGLAVEIKCSRKCFENAENDFIEPYYIAQIQHQMCVLNLKMMFYFAYWGGNFVIKEIHRDENLIRNIIELGTDFYYNLQTLTEPNLMNCDYVNMENNSEWISYANAYIAKKKEREKLEKEEKEYREKLLQLSLGSNAMGAGIKLRKVVSAGRIDWNSIEELKNIDTSRYRKPPIESWRIIS